MSAITNDFGSPFDRRPAWSSVLNNLELRLSRGECPIGSNTIVVSLDLVLHCRYPKRHSTGSW